MAAEEVAVYQDGNRKIRTSLACHVSDLVVVHGDRLALDDFIIPMNPE